MRRSGNPYVYMAVFFNGLHGIQNQIVKHLGKLYLISLQADLRGAVNPIGYVLAMQPRLQIAKHPADTIPDAECARFIFRGHHRTESGQQYPKPVGLNQNVR